MKQRLDIFLFENGYCPSREKAKALIMAGAVFIDGQRADKPGMPVGGAPAIEIKGNPLRYASRGGLKLEKAIESFGLSLTGLVCADIGASTGGFTDCMLQNGAKTVYAVDVGYGQLAWPLRSDSRVVVLERKNARYLTKTDIPEPLDFFSVDVSFISLKLILPAVAPLLAPRAGGVLLVKPQFECGKDRVGKNGVVRDAAVHQEVVEQAIGHCGDNNLSVKGLTFSPITGPEGNIEYLLWAENSGPGAKLDVAAVVQQSHQQLAEA